MKESLELLDKIVEQLILNYNKDTIEHDSMVDQITEQAEKLLTLKSTIEEAGSIIIKQAGHVKATSKALDSANCIVADLRRQNKALNALDPKGSAKRCKGYKNTIADLKAKNTALHVERRSLLNELKSLKGSK